MKVNFIKVGVMEVGFIITSLMEDMKEIGLMGDMMDMELRVGQEVVDIEDSTDKV